MNINKGKIKKALKIVVYGQEGVGKSTFASKFPDPVFIDTEGSTGQLDVARFDAPTSWEMLMQQVEYVRQNPDVCRTLVIDTADWAEKLCIRAVCDRANKDGVEDFGWGKGYTYVQEEFGKLINKLTEVIDKGINVVFTAHAQMRKVEQPDEMGSYDRWELKLTKQCSPLLKEWSDLLLFANYKTVVVKSGDKYKGQGGQQRIMYTSHTASWDAKNRCDLPDVMPFDYNSISAVVEGTKSKAETASIAQPVQHSKPVQHSEPVQQAQREQPKEDPLETFIDEVKEKDVPVLSENRSSVPDYVPKALADLMSVQGLTVSDIEKIVAKRGYFPPGTPFKNYPKDFIDGCLIAAFPQLYDFGVKEGIIDLPF